MEEELLSEDERAVKVIVAMKGYPCTGKTRLARSIAAAHKWPLISDADHLTNNDPFEAVCQIASTQLDFGINVIIDSIPVSRQANNHHLDRLLQLAASTRSRLIVVECVCRDKFEWRNRALPPQGEDHKHSTATTGGKSRYYSWTDIENLLVERQQSSADDSEAKFLETNSSTNFVKMVVDTIRHVRNRDICRAVYHLATNTNLQLGTSTTTLCFDFDDWIWEGNGFGSGSENKGKGNLFGHFHKLTLNVVDESQKGHDDQKVISCRACRKPITTSSSSSSSCGYYNCEGCHLSIHKLCAELPSKKEILPQNYPPFLQSLPHKYSFPETRGTNVCETHKKDFYECSECLFKTNLRCGLLPSVVVNRHEHPLCISFYPFSYNYEFQCKACCTPGQHVSYNCSDCKFVCHPSCALLPRINRDSRHHHTLRLVMREVKYDPDKDQFSEFYCDVCRGTRNLNSWTYFCNACRFVCHLDCLSQLG